MGPGAPEVRTLGPEVVVRPPLLTGDAALVELRMAEAAAGTGVACAMMPAGGVITMGTCDRAGNIIAGVGRVASCWGTGFVRGNTAAAPLASAVCPRASRTVFSS